MHLISTGPLSAMNKAKSHDCSTTTSIESLHCLVRQTTESFKVSLSPLQTCTMKKFHLFLSNPSMCARRTPQTTRVLFWCTGNIQCFTRGTLVPNADCTFPLHYASCPTDLLNTSDEACLGGDIQWDGFFRAFTSYRRAHHLHGYRRVRTHMLRGVTISS